MASAPSEDIIGSNPAPTRSPLLLAETSIDACSTPLEKAVAAMPPRVRGALRHDIKTGARLMLAKPWRIQRALFGHRLGPLPDRVADLIAYADRRRLAEESAGLAGRWTYSANRHLALRQALLALRLLRRSGVTTLDPLW